jgi:hypothetical protein
MPLDAVALAEATTNLLYHSPYVRVAGTVSGGAPVDVALPPAKIEEGHKGYVWAPFVPPPPSAVTTRSFTELKGQRTRPVRYGPHERYIAPQTELQVIGWRHAVDSAAGKLQASMGRRG